MHVSNLAELDYCSPTGSAGTVSLGPDWQNAAVDASVSFDVVGSRPVTRRVNVRDGADGFAGTFDEDQATVTWSAQSSSGFSFTSKPGNFSTSVPEVPGVNGVTAPLNFFAEIAQERNGIFFPGGDPGRAAGALQDPVQQALTPPPLPAALADSPGAGLPGAVAVAPDALLVNALGQSSVAALGGGLAQPAISASPPPAPGTGAAVATPTGSGQAVQRAPAPDGRTADPAHHRVRDLVFTGLDGGGLAAALGPTAVPDWAW